VLQLVVDVVAFDSPDIIDKLFLKKLRNNEMDAKDPGCGRRFVLPLPREKPVSSKWTVLIFRVTIYLLNEGSM
jgi:hypothetical protein